MRLLRIAAAILAAVALSGCGPSDTRGRVTDLAVMGRVSANPSVAARGRFVGVAWAAATMDGVTDIYVATSRDAGRTFGMPTRVNHEPGQASVSGEQPPRIALVPRAGSDPSILVVWTAKASAGTRLLSARSDDGGRSFAPSAPVPGTDAPGNRGWESVAVSREGHVLVTWLDHRELADGAHGAAGMNHAGHDRAAQPAQKADGVARAQLSKLLFARLDGEGSAQTVTSGVCYCCKTAIAAGPDGSAYAAWRHVYPGNIRDIAFTVSRDGGRTFAPPTRVSEDQWVLDGCPENGPAMVVDDAGVVHVVWPTLVPGATAGSEPTLALFHATSRDGRGFTPRQRIPTEGFPRHPQIARGADGGVVVVWDEQAGGSRVAVGRGTVDGEGALRFTREVLTDTAPAAYPVVATTGDGILVAWASGTTGQTVVRTERLAN